MLVNLNITQTVSIEAGGNSNRIVQFRRNGSNRSYIDNNGLYVGTATSARWADLAERYSADAIYENATVMGINLDGESETTKWEPGMPLVGVISTNPAVQMNDMGIKPGSKSKKAKMNPFIALKGRVPCLVNSDVKKGQWVIPCGNGKAKGVDYGTPGIMPHEIIGIAISDFRFTIKIDTHNSSIFINCISRISFRKVSPSC